MRERVHTSLWLDKDIVDRLDLTAKTSGGWSAFINRLLQAHIDPWREPKQKATWINPNQPGMILFSSDEDALRWQTRFEKDVSRLHLRGKIIQAGQQALALQSRISNA